MSATCQGCGTELPPRKPCASASGYARPRKWCSEKCRKAQYAGNCIDCGRTLSGSDGRGPNAPVRCVVCNGRLQGLASRVWTHESVVQCIQDWAAIHGEAPAAPDWNPYQAEYVLHDPERARRWRDGDWPSFQVAIHLYGSWNAAIAAAGFTPRERHGGGANVARRRNQRKAAA